jgi:hypothetical protein
MYKKYLLNMLVLVQLMAILMVQVNTLAPGIARLYPALATGDLSECRCSSGCACSSASRAGGTCCCKQAKRVKLKLHCKDGKTKSAGLSLRACPCGGSSGHINVTSQDNPLFLAGDHDRPIPVYQERQLSAPVMPAPRDNLSEPAIPPPRLLHAGGHAAA